jgi:hypothetical protein
VFDCLTWGSRPPASGRLAARRRSKISHTGPVDLWRGGWAHGVWDGVCRQCRTAAWGLLQPGGGRQSHGLCPVLGCAWGLLLGARWDGLYGVGCVVGLWKGVTCACLLPQAPVGT